ncbi:MAG: hypothetical protein AABY68_07660 [Pseudomonadota bacterium]
MKNELTLDDARLAARIAVTLDKAAQGSDADWDARIADIAAGRIKAPARSHRLQWSGLALAASVTFMLAMPGSWLFKMSNGTVSATQAASVDGQMLEEIDWLMAMEEAASEGR